jgi:CDP-diacylglycerol---glycerol-3-phosphate 3-phosphatidyltransferase
MLKVLRPALARVLTPVGQLLARTPVTPNALTIIGTIGMSAGALWLFPTGHLFAGVMVCTGFVLTDMLDGTLARIKGTTGKFGAFLDSTMDRIADAAVFSGLAAWFVLRGNDKVLAGVALFCLVTGALVSYAKARAESLGLKCDVGFAERTERLLIALVSTGLSGLGVPYVLPIGLWLLAVASVVTFGQRVVAARRSADAMEAAAAPGGETAGTAQPAPPADSAAGGAADTESTPARWSGPAEGSAGDAEGALAARSASAEGSAAGAESTPARSASVDRRAESEGSPAAWSAGVSRTATGGPAADQRDAAPGG